MKFSFFNLFAPQKETLPSADAAFVFSPHYNLSLGAHVFPAHKFSYLHDMLQLDETLGKVRFYEPEACSPDQLALVHTPKYLADFLECRNSERTRFSELPLNPSIVNSFLHAVGGTIEATLLSKEYRYIFNLGGGFHHSFADHAEGFCYVNDVAIASKVYLEKNPGKRVLVIDLDLHQGNGTAAIFQNNANVFTFSMHQENLYPKKEISDLDIPLQDRCSDAEYLELLQKSLERIEKNFQPDIIFYLAGADPYKEDTLGNLQLTMEGLIQRDSLTKQFADRLDCPIIIVTAGGYAKKFQDTVTIHYNTAKVFASQSV
ncbi:MAG: histone deacetylase [Spirochaetota bacterium]